MFPPPCSRSPATAGAGGGAPCPPPPPFLPAVPPPAPPPLAPAGLAWPPRLRLPSGDPRAGQHPIGHGVIDLVHEREGRVQAVGPGEVALAELILLAGEFGRQVEVDRSQQALLGHDLAGDLLEQRRQIV